MLSAVSDFIAGKTWYAWILRVALCWAGIILIGSVITSVVLWLLPTDNPDALRNMGNWLQVVFMASTVISLVLIYLFVRLCFRVLDRRDPRELRMDLTRATPLQLLAGCAAALALLAVVFLFQYAAGWISIKSVSSPFDALYLTAAVSTLVQFASVGLGEEIRYRAYGYASGEGSMPRPVLILATALLFGVFHAQYDAFGGLAIVNLMVIAGFYIASLHLTGSIWFGVGFHCIWDFAQVSIFGLAYSGTAGTSLIVIDQTGPAHWVGGVALIEAGLVYLLAFLLALAVVVGLLKRKQAGPGAGLEGGR